MAAPLSASMEMVRKVEETLSLLRTWSGTEASMINEDVVTLGGYISEVEVVLNDYGKTQPIRTELKRPS